MERTKLALAMEHCRLCTVMSGIIRERVLIDDFEHTLNAIAYCNKHWTKKMLFDSVTYTEERISEMLSDGEISKEFYDELMKANRYDYDVVRKRIAKM